MSTTPQRYDYGDRIEDPMKECDDGPYILFTDHEADKARALEEVNTELNRLRDILQNPSMLRHHVQKQFPEYAWENAEFIGRLRALAEQAEAQQATIAELTSQRDEAFKLSKCQCGTNEACRALSQHQATIARLTKALEIIEQWKAFPAIMHRGQTSSYGTAYGSNGERDYMRSIARDALYTPPVIN